MTLAPALGRLGAPAVMVAPPEPVGTITGVRRDVAGFFGIAPRGPCRLPPSTLEPDDQISSWLARGPTRRTIAVPVTSWDEYRQHFGGFEGPGRLPYAVSAFFDAGGQMAYVARMVHEYGDAQNLGARARGAFEGVTRTGGQPIEVLARSEGAWANALEVTLRFRTRPLMTRSTTTAGVVVDRQEWVPGGSLLRLRLAGDVQELVLVDRSEVRQDDPVDQRHLQLVSPVASAPVAAEVVTAVVEVVDRDRSFSRREVLDDIGFRSDHPRWLARVLIRESTFLWPDEPWLDDEIAVADTQLGPVTILGGGAEPTLVGGEDRWDDVVPEDYWDPSWVPGDEVAGDGVQSLANNDDIGLMVAPDLYSPEPLAPVDDVTDPPTLCGATFAPHVGQIDVPPQAPPPLPLSGLALDPLDAMDRARIMSAQQALVAYAGARRDLTVLLDVPLGLSQRQILDWRNAFDSPYAAAYHPWLDVASPDDDRDALVRVNPSGFAAGIIAERELRLGVHFGPANQIAVGAVRVDNVVPPERHDALHVAGVNVFQPERDGIRLTAARTLALRPSLRQLSVVRLLTALRLSLAREMQWVVFEPNEEPLWAEVRRLVRTFLTRLYEAGAFRGATTKDAFFVTCDRTTMSQNDLDNGRLICLVGVNVAEPIEYIVLEIALETDGTVQLQIVAT